MTDTYYMISEASRLVHVESHVLRYWEEELGLDIPRNELGHRIYMQDHIRLFRVVKILKEKGYQLRAVKELLPHLRELDEDDVKHFQDLHFETVVEEKMEKAEAQSAPAGPQPPLEEASGQTDAPKTEELRALGDRKQQEQMEQFEQLLSDIVIRALERYELQHIKQETEVPVELSERSLEQLTRKIESMLERREEKEEERYRLLDECIRTYQRMNQNQARRGFRLFHRRTAG